MTKVIYLTTRKKIPAGIIYEKENLLYVKSVTAFLDIIDYHYPPLTEQHHTAQFWLSNNQKIIQSISQFSDGNMRIKTSLLHDFGTLSLTARYLAELPVT